MLPNAVYSATFRPTGKKEDIGDFYFFFTLILKDISIYLRVTGCRFYNELKVSIKTIILGLWI